MNYYWKKRLHNASNPKGLWGRIILNDMNKGHAPLTEGGLAMLSIKEDAECLDIGCGGGRTLSRLSVLAPKGKIYGIDVSRTAVKCAKMFNYNDVKSEKMKIRVADVGFLPFPNNKFDIITAIETFYFWKEKRKAVQNVYNALKEGGEFIIMLDAYEDGSNDMDFVKKEIYYELNTPEEIESLFASVGFAKAQIKIDGKKLYAVGIK